MLDTSYNCFTVTPSANKLQYPAECFYIGNGGDVAITPLMAEDGTSVVFKNLGSGTYLLVKAKAVLAVGTTATDIVALY